MLGAMAASVPTVAAGYNCQGLILGTCYSDSECATQTGVFQGGEMVVGYESRHSDNLDPDPPCGAQNKHCVKVLGIPTVWFDLFGAQGTHPGTGVNC